MRKIPKYNFTPNEEKRLSEWIEKFEESTKQIAKLEKVRLRYRTKIMALIKKSINEQQNL